MELPNIKPIRNENIDYTNGSFFITIAQITAFFCGTNQQGWGSCPIRLTDTATVVETDL